MKALTVRQPWAFWIAVGQKDIENRSWSTNFRGPLAIHAAKGVTEDEYLDAIMSLMHWFDAGACQRLEAMLPPLGSLERGGIVAITELHKCVGSPRSLEHVLPWETPEGYGLHLRHTRRVELVPCKGALGLWDLPPDIEDRIVDKGGFDGQA